MYEPLRVPLSDPLELLVDALPVVPTLRGSEPDGPLPGVALDRMNVGIALACARRVARAPVAALEALAPD
jgi:hypothetical protein